MDKTVVHLGACGPTGHKIAELLHKRMSRLLHTANRSEINMLYDSAREPAKSGEKQIEGYTAFDAYRLWAYSRFEVENTGDTKVTLRSSYQHPIGYGKVWPGHPSLVELSETDIKLYFAAEADAAVCSSPAVKIDDLVQVYGQTDSIIYKARVRDLNCFIGLMTGKTVEQLTELFGEKSVKAVVGNLADPMKVELRNAADEEAAKMEKERDVKIQEMYSALNQDKRDVERRRTEKKNVERGIYYGKLNAIDAEMNSKLAELEQACRTAVDELRKETKEKIKAIRKELR